MQTWPEQTIRVEDVSASGRRRVFHLLDAIRGVAALIVVQRHSTLLFGADAWPSTFLVVDLFFVLSGFVIAYSYEDRLAERLTWGRFMALRVIRLYPLYLIGLLLGSVELLGNMYQSRHAAMQWAVVAQALLSAALLLPNWDLPSIVGPRWSLTYELVVNAGYAVLHRHLGRGVLWLVIASAGAGLIFRVTDTGTLDSGWQWYQAPTALARVFFSFGAGVAIYFWHDCRLSRAWILRFAGLGVALCALSLIVLGTGRAAWELVVMFGGFPALTLLATTADVRGPAAQLCGFLGTTSYAVYVIHQPAALLFRAVVSRIPALNRMTPALTGWCFVIGLLLAAWLLDRFYDGPVRRWLVRISA